MLHAAAAVFLNTMISCQPFDVRYIYIARGTGILLIMFLAGGIVLCPFMTHPTTSLAMF